MDKQGLIEVYTGDGKGKSTAAFGLALRAAGWGLHTAIVQFMKHGEGYGETQAIAAMPAIDLYSFGIKGFLHKGEPPDAESLSAAKAAMAKAAQLMGDQRVDILVLDEINNAIDFGLVSEEDALELIQKKPLGQELILTGRHAPETIIAIADLVTEMKEIKHPYHQGIPARRGIEY